MGEDGIGWDARRWRREEKVVTELNTRPRPAGRAFACPPACLAALADAFQARRFGALERKIQGGSPCRGVVCTASASIVRHVQFTASLLAMATDTWRARSP